MLATVTTRVWPASTGATTPGSVTVTVADPSAGTATRSGATELPNSVRVPSWATSAVPTNSTASAGAGWPGTRATVSCTRGAPATVSGAATGALGNCAVWPGIAPEIAVSRPATAPSAPPRPGSDVIAAGLPPAGLRSTCGSPDSGRSCRVVRRRR